LLQMGLHCLRIEAEAAKATLDKFDKDNKKKTKEVRAKKKRLKKFWDDIKDKLKVLKRVP
jgi:hypothetical protein